MKDTIFNYLTKHIFNLIYHKDSTCGPAVTRYMVWIQNWQILFGTIVFLNLQGKAKQEAENYQCKK